MEVLASASSCCVSQSPDSQMASAGSHVSAMPPICTFRGIKDGQMDGQTDGQTP